MNLIKDKIPVIWLDIVERRSSFNLVTDTHTDRQSDYWTSRAASSQLKTTQHSPSHLDHDTIYLEVASLLHADAGAVIASEVCKPRFIVDAICQCESGNSNEKVMTIVSDLFTFCPCSSADKFRH